MAEKVLTVFSLHIAIGKIVLVLKVMVKTLLSDMLYEHLINNCTKYDALQNAFSKSTRLSHCKRNTLISAVGLQTETQFYLLKKEWFSHMHVM